MHEHVCPSMFLSQREKQKQQNEKEKLQERFYEIEVRAGKINDVLSPKTLPHLLVSRRSKKYSASLG